MTGLGKEWSDIVNSLLRISNYYRELNNAISFGTDIKVRREAVERSLKDPFRVYLQHEGVASSYSSTN